MPASPRILTDARRRVASQRVLESLGNFTAAADLDRIPSFL
jgi:hypothetical protein